MLMMKAICVCNDVFQQELKSLKRTLKDYIKSTLT